MWEQVRTGHSCRQWQVGFIRHAQRFFNHASFTGFATSPRRGRPGGHLFPPPDCLNCTSTTVPYITKHNNPNGNGGRPYYKCIKCPAERAFCTFADKRNVDPSNPPCGCHRDSRGEVSSPAKGQRVFYKCWQAKCRFWEWADEQTTDSEASSTPPKAKSKDDFWSPVKVERSDVFRAPSAVEAESSHVFRSPSPMKVKASEVLPSPVEVKHSEVSPSPKKNIVPLSAEDDFTEGLARLTLNSVPTPEPKRSRFLCGGRWIRRWKV